MEFQRVIVNLHRAAAAFCALALACCTNPVDTHGNLPDPDKLAQIKPGTTDKATVTELLGSPSSTSAFDPNVWYYIAEKTRPEAARYPELVDQQVIAVYFDDKGIVRDVSHAGMADREEITPNPNATPAPGREFTVLEQLIGNFGRFSAPEKKGPGGGGIP
jgi:outer membrane protein assembly factor BamE (lipoprotein component of BamABCDE complex)